MAWWGFALLSAVAAAVTTVTAKMGMAGLPSNLATAIRTGVVLIFAWAIVVARGEHQQMASLTPRAYFWLVLSGLGTGISWLAYFRALQMGPVASVASVDKLSLVFTVVLAALVLGEQITLRTACGAALVAAGTLLMVR
ncbi:MAG: EamA family transporter [Acidobacteriota bacterium]